MLMVLNSLTEVLDSTSTEIFSGMSHKYLKLNLSQTESTVLHPRASPLVSPSVSDRQPNASLDLNLLALTCFPDSSLKAALCDSAL